MSDGWIKWNGGPCPVSLFTKVEAKRKDGSIITGKAMTFGWLHHNWSDDVIVYRIVKEG